MAFIPLGGKTRRYLNTETGESISRRQYQNLMQGVSFEEKARRNREADLAKALARPAHGRTKARTETEIEQRLENARIQAESNRVNRITKKAQQAAKRIRVKKITPQLLKAGHRAARIPFSEYSDYEELYEQMNSKKLPNGRRLVFAYGLGITGFDERTGRELDATMFPLQSATVYIDEDEFETAMQSFMDEKVYFIFSHYWIHLQYDINYAEEKQRKARAKNIPPEYRKRKR